MEFLGSTFSQLTLFIIIIAFVIVLTIGLIFSKLYIRATKEVAFVRTGLGGEKVIKDGGAIVLPIVHETIPVNMNTLRIEVEKTKKDALITKDRMRVDVKTDFYLRVAPNADGISMAAQTLGTRTTRVEEVKALMESKFVDVLRAVAAEMTMTEMHEQRADFVQKVQQNVANDLEKNGLELETVSLTGFDQTDLDFFNENNAFDAEGRARLAKIIEEKRKETNDIQQENRIKIEQRNLEAEKLSLDVQRNEEEARLDQEQILSFRRQEQKAEIAKQREQKEQEETEALIAKERTVEIAKIEKSKEIEMREISKKQALQQSTIQQQQAVEVANQVKQIAIAEKSEEESAARAKAAEAEKLKVEKEESVITAKQLAEANRRKDIEVIDAKKEAERDAVSITTEASAKKEASQYLADAILTEAKASSDAKILQAEADEKVLAVEAAGKEALHQAENTLKIEQIELQKTLSILKVLPEVVESAVKPLENIEGIKILQGYGVQSNTSQGNESGSSNIADQVTKAALNYRANAPLIDSLLQDIGMVDSKNGSLHDLVSGNNILMQTTNTASTVHSNPEIEQDPETGSRSTEEIPE